MNPLLRPALLGAVLLALPLLALPLLTGCQHAGNVRVVTQSDNGATITLSHHDQLQVNLPGNPTTGYSWQTVKVNSWVLAPLGRPSFKSGAESPGTNGTPMIGAGGILTLTYEAVGVGTTPLELNYSRPWEHETAPSQSFQITVIVSH